MRYRRQDRPMASNDHVFPLPWFVRESYATLCSKIVLPPTISPGFALHASKHPCLCSAQVRQAFVIKDCSSAHPSVTLSQNPTRSLTTAHRVVFIQKLPCYNRSSQHHLDHKCILTEARVRPPWRERPMLVPPPLEYISPSCPLTLRQLWVYKFLNASFTPRLGPC